MSRLPDLNSSKVRWIAGLLFAVGISIWTWKLLVPQPVSDEFVGELLKISDLLPFLLAKSLHFTGYAGLTGLLIITLGRHWRYGVLFMLLHGAGTEIGQTFVPNRTGKVRDVVLDSCGILTGMVITRRLQRLSSAT